MTVRIYRPAKTAVSSGRFKTRNWIVEHEPRSKKEPDRLIGWVGSDDTEQQIRLQFPSKEAAIAYCVKNDLPYQLTEPETRTVKPKSYAANFIRKT